MQQSLRAVVTGIQNQIKLVGKVAEGAPESIRNLWDLGELTIWIRCWGQLRKLIMLRNLLV